MTIEEKGTIFCRPPPQWPQGMGIDRPTDRPTIHYPPVIGGYLETLCMLIIAWQLEVGPDIPYPVQDKYRRKLAGMEEKEGKNESITKSKR